MQCLFPSPRPLSQIGPYGTILKNLNTISFFKLLQHLLILIFLLTFHLFYYLVSDPRRFDPIIYLIPSQIIKSYSHFSTKSLVYLSQLVDVDGTYIQSYLELIFSKIVPRAGVYLNWYKDLLTVVCVNPSTRKLHHQYQVPASLTPNLPLTLVNFQRPAARTWVAHWNTSTNSILFGRIVKNSVSKFTAMLDHWIPDPVNTTTLTPTSSTLKLTCCPGCHIKTTLPPPSATAKPPYCGKGATCLLNVSNHTMLSLRPYFTKTPRNIYQPGSILTLKVSLHYLSAQLNDFAQCLAIAPAISPAPEPSPNSSLESTSILCSSTSSSSTPDPYIFHTDGSLTHPRTERSLLGFGWVQSSSEGFIPTDYKQRII